MTYLDYAASSIIDQRVVGAMLSVYKEHPGNASSRTHSFGNDCRKLVEEARSDIAQIVGAQRDEVIFTSGATESDNLAILGLLDYGISVGKMHIVTTSIEHKAVLATMKHAESLGFEITFIDPETSGSVSADSVIKAVRENTLLVSVMHVNNETGAIQPISEIGQRLSLLEDPPFFHVDAAQSAGKLVKSLQEAKYDLLSICAHKMYGPQGIGALIARKRGYKQLPLKGILHGGGQEGSLRSGTLPVALIAGFGKAAHLCGAEWESDYSDAVKIREAVEYELEAAGVTFSINASGSVLPNIMNVRFPGVSSEALMIAGKQYFSISNGSACNAQSYSPSYVLQRMGLSNEESMESIRISWGRGSDIHEISKAAKKMAELVSAYQ